MARLIDTELGQKLNALRLSQNMSFAELADKSGLGVATVKRMLSKGAFGEIDGLKRVFIVLGLEDKLMSGIRECIPDVNDSLYFKERRRASRKANKPGDATA